MSLRVQLLGGFAVWKDGKLIQGWKTDQAKDLFKILLTRPGQLFPSDLLIEYLWPEIDYDQGLKFLRARIHELRQTLEPGGAASASLIETGPDGYRLNPKISIEVDTAAFEQHLTKAKELQNKRRLDQAAKAFERALDACAGDYLPEDRYKEWAIEEGQQWRRLYVSALLDQADCLAQQGEYRRAVDRCLAALGKDPCREDVYRQAMLFHHLLGNRSQALQLYQQCKQTLEKELGEAPGQELQRLSQQIQSGYVPGVDKVYPPARPAPTIALPLEKMPFTGRKKEYNQLVAAVERAANGQGQLVLIGGQAGVGKTRLAQEAIAYAASAHGATQLYGASTRIGANLPYQGLLHALQEYLTGQPALDQLPALGLDVLGPWLPELKRTPLPTLSPQEDRLRFFNSVSLLLEAIAQHHAPTILFLDDLHWAGPSTVEFLDFLLPTLKDQPLLVLGTYRMEELEPDSYLGQFLKQVVRPGQNVALHLVLESLSAREIEALLQELMPKLQKEALVELAASFYKESAGNPLFLRAVAKDLSESELLAAMPDGGWLLDLAQYRRRDPRQIPKDIESILQQQLKRLGTEDQALLGTLSVFGAQADEAHVRQVWQALHPHEVLSSSQWVERLERLEGGFFIRCQQSHVRFSHDRIQEVVYQQLTSARRQLYHQTAIGVLEETYKDRADPPHALLAHHYVQAERLQDALGHFLPALQDAVAGYRNQEALQLAEAAWQATVQLVGRGQALADVRRLQWGILSQKAQLFDHLGQRTEQGETIESVLVLSRELGGRHLLDALLLKMNYEIRIAAYDQAIVDSRRLLALAEQQQNLAYQAKALRQLSRAHFNKGEHEKAFDFLENERSLAAPSTSQERAQTAYYLATLCLDQGRYPEATAHLAEALDMFKKLNHQEQITRILLDRGVVYWSQGDFSKACEELDRARALAEAIGAVQLEAHALSNLGMVLNNTGAFEQAIHRLQQAAHLHERMQDARTHALDLNNLGWAHFCVGNDEEAERLFQKTLELAQRIGWKDTETTALHNLAQVRLRAGQFEAAEPMLQQALEFFQSNGNLRDQANVLRSFGQLHLEQGDGQRALGAFQESLKLNEGFGAKIEQMRLHAFLCLAYLDLEGAQSALAHSEQALGLLEKIHPTPHAPLVHFSRFQALQTQKPDKEAQAALRAAHEVVLRYAGEIEDKRLHACFLEIPLHRDILEAHQAQAALPSTEAACYELLRRVRWPDGARCVVCNGANVRPHGQVEKTAEQRYWCRDCRKTFSDRTGTPFANRNIPLNKLMQALSQMAHGALSDAGALAQAIGVHANTAAKLYPVLKQALKGNPLVKDLIYRAI